MYFCKTLIIDRALSCTVLQTGKFLKRPLGLFEVPPFTSHWQFSSFCSLRVGEIEYLSSSLALMFPNNIVLWNGLSLSVGRTTSNKVHNFTSTIRSFGAKNYTSLTLFTMNRYSWSSLRPKKFALWLKLLSELFNETHLVNFIELFCSHSKVVSTLLDTHWCSANYFCSYLL